MNNKSNNSKRRVKKIKKNTNLKTKQVLKSRNAVVANGISRNIAKANKAIRQPPTPAAFSDYIRALLYHDQPLVTSPLESRKMFYKKIKYQDTITVNSAGHCFVGGSMFALAGFDKTSTASPILYANQTTYDPTITTNSLTGGWNLAIIGPTGLNVSLSEVKRQYVQSAHIKVSITGVSNLNKQGQIHMFEDVDHSYRYGTSTDTTQNDLVVNEYPIQDLPKCNHYKRVDIMNMDSSTALEYNYIPLQNPLTYYSLYPNAETTNSSGNENINKTFGIIVSNAASGTTLRLEYEIVLVQEIDNNYINNYPPVYSNIFVDADPALQMLQQNTGNILRTEKHQDLYDLVQTVKKHDHEGYTHIKGVEIVKYWSHHLPFHNYAGPGTDVINQLSKNKRPINYLDQAALIHDIDYTNPYITKEDADHQMIQNLISVKAVATAMLVKVLLKIGNRFGKKENNITKYIASKELAIKKGYINPLMKFTSFTM